MGLVLPVGMRMLIWAEYHERTLRFSREYSINFLNSSFFTQQGIIDSKKAAEELMSDKNLSIVQKFKLSCLYCFTDHIPVLYRQMTKEDKEKLCSKITQLSLVRFWSYFLIDEVDKIIGNKTVDQYRLETAVERGSKAAVEYCLEKTNLNSKKDAVVDAAMEAVRCKVKAEPCFGSDWVFFLNQYYRGCEKPWVPSDYYIDILCFLLSKMNEGQQIDFLKKDIEHVKYVNEYFKDPIRSSVLEYFLNWPYQNYFMETAGLLWEFLPERSYAVLLLRICDKIEPEKENLKLVEEKSYDYRGLFKEFWYQSPERYKKYVLSNQKVTYIINEPFKTKTGVGLLIKLLTLKNFTHEDVQNIRMILASAANKEKENIIYSKDWRNFCTGLIEEEKWQILDRFFGCFSSMEEADTFKRELTSTKEVQGICIDFIKNEKWNAAEAFIKTTLPAEEVDKFKRELTCTKKVQCICIDFVINDKCYAAESFIKLIIKPEEEMHEFKKEIIYSQDGKCACKDLILYTENLVVENKISKLCFSSEEKVREFKKELIFSEAGVNICGFLVVYDMLERVDKLIRWSIFSQEKVKEFKKEIAYRVGAIICERFISDYSVEDNHDEQGYDTIRRTTKFKGGKWEEVEKFLTWCSSSEEEISDFKKNVLLKEAGKEIHFNLIKSNQWKEAETFFAWLGLSAEEIKELKKDTLFNYDAASEMFSELMYSKEGDERFVDYGNKKEAIELLLWWYLTDKEAILEFKDKFKHRYHGEATDERKAVFENFDLMIEQRLNDLDEEQRGVKRKSETFFSF